MTEGQKDATEQQGQEQEQEKGQGRGPGGNRRLLVLGLGNEILSDDAVGILLAREIQESLTAPNGWEVDFVEASLAGFNLLDLIAGYNALVLVDSILTGKEEPGEVFELDLDSLRATLRLSSVHDINLATALKLGEELGMAMPEHVRIFVMEVIEISRFSEELTPAVREALPGAVARITGAIGLMLEDIS